MKTAPLNANAVEFTPASRGTGSKKSSGSKFGFYNSNMKENMFYQPGNSRNKRMGGHFTGVGKADGVLKERTFDQNKSFGFA